MTMTMTTEQCSNCKFFKKYNEGNHNGVCRRYPPANVANVYQDHGEIVTDVNTAYPHVKYFGWCGEWK